MSQCLREIVLESRTIWLPAFRPIEIVSASLSSVSSFPLFLFLIVNLGIWIFRLRGCRGRGLAKTRIRMGRPMRLLCSRRFWFHTPAVRIGSRRFSPVPSPCNPSHPYKLFLKAFVSVVCEEAFAEAAGYPTRESGRGKPRARQCSIGARSGRIPRPLSPFGSPRSGGADERGRTKGQKKRF